MLNEKQKNIILAVVLIVIGLVMAVASWNILPETVATQFGVLDTGAPTIPKIVAVILPLAITTIFAIYGINYRKQAYISIVGYAMNILFWLSNM